MLLFPFLPAVQAESGPSLNYDMVVDINGTGIINVNFTDPSSIKTGTFWILVPTNLSFAASSINGRLLNHSLSSKYVFYDNLTIWYEAPFSIQFEWTLPYAVLIVEPDAFLYSPAIGFSAAVTPTFTVHLPNSTSRVVEFSQMPIYQKDLDYSFRPGQGDARIAIAFQVNGKPDIIYLNSSRFSIKFPRRYESLGIRTLNFYEAITPALDDVFNTSLSDIKVELFVPKTLEDLSIGGFTPISSAYKLGTIFLNLLWVRTEEGYFESIAAHELVHHYLFTVGISTDLLWFHEGMANYIGISISKIAGQGAAVSADELLGVANELKESGLSFVYRWRPDSYIPGYGIFEHYAASYYIVANISQELASPSDKIVPGQKLLSSVFRYVRESNLKIETNDELARIIFMSANFSMVAYTVLNTFDLRVDPFTSRFGKVTIDSGAAASFSELLIEPLIAPSIYAAYNETILVDPAKAEVIVSEAIAFINGFETSAIFFLFVLAFGLIAREVEVIERNQVESVKG